jgi:hypothetical protein
MKELKYYYTQSGTEEGPFLRKQIQILASRGIIKSDTIIKEEGGGKGNLADFMKLYGWPEDQKLKELKAIKWAVRGVGFLIALIVLFGLTIAQK